MTTYNLSAFAGAGAQFFDDNGTPLVGGKLYSYAAGTTTLLTTYTTSAGTVANTNPIILNAGGRTPNEIWQATGILLKFALYNSVNELIGTYDGIPSINDPFGINSQLTSIAGTNSITAAATPTITAYATGAIYSFIAVNTNTGAATLSIDGLTATSITKNGSVALSAGDIQSGKMMLVEYDGTAFQLVNNIIYGGSVTNGTITNSTITGGSITSLTTPLAIASGGTAGATALAGFNNLKQAATTAYTGVVQLATDAEAVAGTDATKAITPSTLRTGVNVTGTAPIYAPRFWVNFNGTGTIAITGSGNVSSITDGGVGVYTVNLTTAMPANTYAVVATIGPRSGTFSDVITVSSTTTSSVLLNAFRTNDATGGANDYAIVNVVGIGG
jgi:hypothetical protein